MIKQVLGIIKLLCLDDVDRVVPIDVMFNTKHGPSTESLSTIAAIALRYSSVLDSSYFAGRHKGRPETFKWKR